MKFNNQQRGPTRPSMLGAVLKKQANAKKESLGTQSLSSAVAQDVVSPSLTSSAQPKDPDISKKELLDRLTREIKTLIEMIMNPHTTDERRKELNASYNEKLSAFQKLGGVFDEYLARDGWHPNADLGKASHNKELEAERLKQ